MAGLTLVSLDYNCRMLVGNVIELKVLSPVLILILLSIHCCCTYYFIYLLHLILGGTLKIYGNSVNPDVPYKTLLLSVTDTVEHVVRETLEKYGKEKDDPDKFCLVQVKVFNTRGNERLETKTHFKNSLLAYYQ